MIQYREMTSISSVNCGSSLHGDQSDFEDDVSSIQKTSEVEVNTESKLNAYLDQIATLRQQMASLRHQQVNFEQPSELSQKDCNFFDDENVTIEVAAPLINSETAIKNGLVSPTSMPPSVCSPFMHLDDTAIKTNSEFSLTVVNEELTDEDRQASVQKCIAQL